MIEGTNKVTWIYIYCLKHVIGNNYKRFEADRL